MTYVVPGIPTGPVESEPRPLASLGFHATRDHQEKFLRQILDDAGIELGAYDERIAAWLAGADWGTAATVMSWVQRASRAGTGAAAGREPAHCDDAPAMGLGDPRED
ncbi:hypothetical protein ACSCBZ_46755 [Streptomyces niveiscabiei]|uniref:hypothetical protein n=1 Tax=Streptomyces niveiscabiei TaxID=164115 RepID=UPI0006EB3CCC|nr:hypothetical protein [Streptomyces niveiscabiei]